MKKKFALSLAISSMFIFTGSPEALAVDYQDLLRSIIDKKLGTDTNVSQQLTKTNINNRQAQLEQEIEAGVNTGQITPEEETELRGDLVRIAHHESAYLNDGTFQDPEVVQLLSELNALSAKIQSYMSNSTTTGTGNLSHDAWFRKFGTRPTTNTGLLPNANLRKAHIDAMQAEIDSAIQSGIVSGSLNWNESRNLTNELNRIKQNEVEYLRDGRIDWDEEQKLLADLRSLEKKVGWRSYNDRRGRGYHGRRNTAHRHNLLHQRIADKVKEGKLSRRDAFSLYQKESRVKDLEQRLRNNTKLTFNQERTMYKELEQLTQDIEQKLNSL